MQDLAAVAFVLVPTPVIPSSSRPVIPPSSRPVIPPPSRVVVPPIIVPLHGPRLVVPIPVVASRHPYQDARHTVRIDPIKPGLGERERYQPFGRRHQYQPLWKKTSSRNPSTTWIPG